MGLGGLHFILPGDPETRTGGFIYDKRIIEALTAAGLPVVRHCLPDGFPEPDKQALKKAAAVLQGIAAGETVVIDGLAMGVIADLLRPHAERLRLVALIHHALADETGLSPQRQGALFASEREALGLAERVVTTSRHTARRLADYGVESERIGVVVPGVDPAPLAEGSGGPDLRLLCVGSLIPRKGHALLIEALSHLTDRPWRLVCVGSTSRDPDTATQVRDVIRQHALERRVDLVGELAASELEAQYGQADLFVLASYHEGYGMVFSEAIAHGLPIVATSGGAVPESVPTEAAFLIPPGDAHALAEALASVMDDRGLRKRLAAGARRARNRLPRWADAASQFIQALGLDHDR